MRIENAIGEWYAFFSLNLHFKLIYKEKTFIMPIFFSLSFVYSTYITADHQQNLTRNEEKNATRQRCTILFSLIYHISFFYHLFTDFPSHLTRNKPLLEKKDDNATPKQYTVQFSPNFHISFHISLFLFFIVCFLDFCHTKLETKLS